MWNIKRFRDGLKLKRLQDWDGKKLSTHDLASIDKHKQMVQEYLDRYPDRKARLYIARENHKTYALRYKIIRDNVERAARHSENEERQTQEAEKRAAEAKAREQRITKQREEDRRDKEKAAIKQARFNIEKADLDIESRTQMVQEYVDRVESNEARVARLSDAYLDENYKGSSQYGLLLKDRNKKRDELPRLRKKLAERKQRLAEAVKMRSDAYEFLGETPPVVEVPVVEQPAEVQQAPLEPDWKPLWNKPAQSKFRELKNIPSSWDATKVVLIFRGDSRQEMRVFAPDLVAAKSVVHALTGSDPVENIKIAGARHDFVISRRQHDKASGD